MQSSTSQLTTHSSDGRRRGVLLLRLDNRNRSNNESTDAINPQANVVAAYRFCGWGLGMFCLPTSVVTGLPAHLSATIRRFALGFSLDEIRRVAHHQHT